MADEKEDEKEREKHEEKDPEEKWRRDPVNAIIWAAILIWAGLVLLASNLGILDNLVTRGFSIPGVDLSHLGAWSLIFIGAGALVLLEALIRVLMPAYRKPIGGTILLGVIFLAIGLGGIFGDAIILPLILIAIGFSILLRGLLRDRS